MKKLLLLLICFAAFSGVFSQNISTGVATWTVNSGPAAQAIATPHWVWNGCMATPVAVTSARWISPTGSVNVAVGVFNFETIIPVPAANSSLRLNFSVAADDDLQALELVDPSNNVIPLRVPAVAQTCAYALRIPTDTTIGCAQQGNWRLRARVQFLDVAGGFILSGSATISTGNCCRCGNWGNISIGTKGFQRNMTCRQTLIVSKTSAVSVSPSFTCNTGCKPRFSAMLTMPNGQTQSFNDVRINFTPNVDGQYRLTISPRCGEQNCTPCVLNFVTSPGCPGEILPTRRTDFSMLDIGFINIVTPLPDTLFALTINAPEKTVDIPNGNYLVAQDKENLLLVDARNRSIVEKYPRNPVPPPNLCNEQAQWDSFKTNVYPGLLRLANETCKPVRYCLGIYCNGQPATFYFLLITPTSRRCAIISEATADYYRIRNLRAE